MYGHAVTPPEIAGEILRALPELGTRDRWPTVSAIVPTHDGRHLLERLVAGLRATDYPGLELVVVDNASTDGTSEWLEQQPLPFTVSLVRNTRNQSFSAACNLGAADARGELLLFLNNDVEPLEPSWLRRLVLCRDERRAGIVGGLLIDPDRPTPSGRPGAVQHHGVAFSWRGGTLRPHLRHLGEDPLELVGRDEEAAAVAAACALIRREDFEAVGGFHDGFWYGAEDVDLCLALRARGRSAIACGSAVLLHRPLSTRRAAPDNREAGRANHRLLLERWGPAVRREFAEDRREEAGIWTLPEAGDGPADPAPLLCVAAGPGASAERVRALVDALAATGWSVTTRDPSDGWLLADVVLHLRLAPGAHTVVPGRVHVAVAEEEALSADDARRYDAVVAASEPADALIEVCERVLDRSGGARRVAPVRVEVVARDARPDSPGSSLAVVVLGMARTGSSAVTRILNLLGVELGGHERLLGAIEDVNEKGFYEHYEIMRLNTALLKRLGGSWREPPDLEPGWERDPALDDLRDRAAETLERDFAGAPLWGFKDPRTCLTLPFWRPLIGEARFVICHRNPLEIAASVERRDGLAQEVGLDLWRRYVCAAITETTGEPRLVISYERLCGAPLPTADQLASFIDRTAVANERAIRAEISAWVEAAMRHHASSLSQALAEPALSADDRSLLLLLELAATGREGLDSALGLAAHEVHNGATTPSAP